MYICFFLHLAGNRVALSSINILGILVFPVVPPASVPPV